MPPINKLVPPAQTQLALATYKATDESQKDGNYSSK